MTLDQANDLAARTLAAIEDRHDYGLRADVYADHQERIVSDLAGIEAHADSRDGLCGRCSVLFCSDAARYAAGLRRTAALYGVTE